MTDIVTTFAALGDPTRLAIVERLLAEGALAAGDLQDVAEISAPAISRHLKVLREAGIVSQEIDAQRRIYAVRADAMARVNAWVLEHEEFWRSSLDRLAQALED